MSKSDLSVGIIGCGGIAKSHAGAWKENGCNIKAVTDVSREAMDVFVDSIGCGAAKMDSFQSLIDSGLVDVISVCSPPAFHAESVIYALEKEMHVLCEKPLAESVESARRIVSVAEKSSSKIMPAFRHRFLPAIIKIKQMVEDGAIGEVVFFQNCFCGPAFAMKDKWFCHKNIAGGGCMLDTSSHSVDLFRYIIGEINEKSAILHSHFNGTDVEDAAILSLKSQSGALGTLASSFVAGDGVAFIDIIGQKGHLVYDYCKPDIVRYKSLGREEWDDVEVKPSRGFSEEVAAFIDAIETDTQPPVTVYDGLRCLEVICSTY